MQNHVQQGTMDFNVAIVVFALQPNPQRLPSTGDFPHPSWLTVGVVKHRSSDAKVIARRESALLDHPTNMTLFKLAR
jgi:hypothetical protein